MSRIILTLLFVSALELTASSANAGAMFDDDRLRPQQILINRPCAEGIKDFLDFRTDAFGCRALGGVADGTYLFALPGSPGVILVPLDGEPNTQQSAPHPGCHTGSWAQPRGGHDGFGGPSLTVFKTKGRPKFSRTKIGP